MLRTSPVLLATVLLAAPLFLTAGDLKLLGKIDPPPGKGTAVIRGVDHPYYDETGYGSGGRFRFRNLEPGAYTVTVFTWGFGGASRSVRVSEAAADARGWNRLDIAFDPSDAAVFRSLQERGAISFADYCTPPFAKNQLKLARRALNQRDTGKAVSHLRKALRVAPTFADALAELGRIKLFSGAHAEALEHFRLAAGNDPHSFDALAGLGDALLALEQYRNARGVFRRALVERPDDPHAHAQLGFIYYSLGEPERAEHCFIRAKEIDPAHISHPQVFLARIHLRRGERNEAIRELEDFVSQHLQGGEPPTIADWLENLEQDSGIASLLTGDAGGEF